MRLKLILLVLILIAPTLAANVNLDELDIIKFSIAEGESKTVQFNNVEYNLFADLVIDAEARVTFQPGNLALAIKKEQSLDDIDIDNDGKIDFSISYLSNVDKKATIELTRLNPETAETGEKEEEKNELPKAEAITAALKQNLKYIIGAVVVLIILILVFSKRKGNPEKFYRRAEDLHREAQEFHEDGDEETSLELYQKAEELREKARGLEKGGL
ncbi:hypothetical protein HYT56_00150 [Candidatus Woesearchaeota archaeon]|nr:hypothetical protein [Candidatus Woesearchaeota archaeon]